MKYGITRRKMAHIIRPNAGGSNSTGFYDTACGIWIKPENIAERVPANTQICTKCAKRYNLKKETWGHAH